MSRQPPAARVGDYHVLDFVGAGGMGEVFRAVHEGSGRVVAAKFLSGSARDLKSRERFAHEARVQASLKHPNLAAFYEWHEVNGVPCIVMEFVDGVTLADRIAHSGAFSLKDALSIFARVGEAIAWMHEQGVVHRDIKSGNVKINARGEVKLLDFGIAKTEEAPNLTQTGAFIGTLQYLSPEQIKGGRADARSDVWALGVLFYEMLSGRVPFEAPTIGELLEKVGRASYPPLRVIRSDVPREIEAVVRRCLQKQPAARYADARALCADLARLKSGNSSSVPANSPVPLRARAFVIAGATILFLVAVGGWNLTRTPTNSLESTPRETPTSVPVRAANLLSDVPKSESKTITIDVFEGASQTQIWRDGELLGRPPLPIEARLDEEIELVFMREGFQTLTKTFTVTNSRRDYSFNLEPLAEQE